MREPRFKEGDIVQVVRIFAASMDLDSDLDPGLQDEYYTTCLGKVGEVIEVELRETRDDMPFFVYELCGEDFELWFHEGELDYYAGKSKIH